MTFAVGHVAGGTDAGRKRIPNPPVIAEAELVDPYLESGDFLVPLHGDRDLDNTRAVMDRFAATHTPPLRVKVTRFARNGRQFARVRVV